MMFKKVPTQMELFEKILAIDETREAAKARVEREIKKLYKSFFAQAKAMVSEGSKTSNTVRLEQINQLNNILLDSGYEDVIQKYLDQFEKLTASAKDYYSPFGDTPTLAGVSIRRLEAYIRFTEGELRAWFPQKLVAPLQSALLQVNFGTRERSDVYDQVLALEDSLTYKQSVTLVNDAFASYQRATIVETAESAELYIYQYLGPFDKITSDQCQAMLTVNRYGVPGMLYKEDINTSLHKALARDPLVGGGHPNCRHQWSPVTEAYAEAKGFKLK